MQTKSIGNSGDIIVIYKPVYTDFNNRRSTKEEDEAVADNTGMSLARILEDKGGYLTVYASSVRPFAETGLDKLVSLSQSDSLAKLSLNATSSLAEVSIDHEMKEE